MTFQGYIGAGCPEDALPVHDEILELGLNPDRLTYNTLISACVKAGKLDDAMRFFDEMKVTSMLLKGQFRASVNKKLGCCTKSYVNLLELLNPSSFSGQSTKL